MIREKIENSKFEAISGKHEKCNPANNLAFTLVRLHYHTYIIYVTYVNVLKTVHIEVEIITKTINKTGMVTLAYNPNYFGS
jgi:hypothetical protein